MLVPRIVLGCELSAGVDVEPRKLGNLDDAPFVVWETFKRRLCTSVPGHHHDLASGVLQIQLTGLEGDQHLPCRGEHGTLRGIEE